MDVPYSYVHAIFNRSSYLQPKTQKVIPTFVLSYQIFLTQHSSIFLLQIHSLVFVTIYVVQILSY